jgi:exodeoxyribonuclease VII large subunit
MPNPDLFTAETDDSLAFTVSEVTAQVKDALEALPMCWVLGEVSDFARPSSGHCYLTLVDEESQLSCVMFRFHARTLSFSPVPGMKVLAYGSLSVYERGGRYQFYAQRLRPAGVGDLALAFLELRNRLEKEGLFNEDRKRVLPRFPRTIGVVTSLTGAAVRDIVNVLTRRSPGTQIVLRPARVQGMGAAEEIARAIRDMNRETEADVLIVGRGGGSPEDLWSFNEEVVARAIFASRIPVVSAVGHEIDYTIADYVADYRAPTPSAAAEIVTQERGILLRQLSDHRRRLHMAVRNRLDHFQHHLSRIDPQRLIDQLRQRFDQSDQYLDESRQRLHTGLDRHMADKAAALRDAVLRLDAVNPLSGLARGFAYCGREEDGRPVRSSRELAAGERVQLRFQRGAAVCLVESTDDEKTFVAAALRDDREATGADDL